MTPEEAKVLRKLGFPDPTIEDIQAIQIRAMEQQAKLWAFTLEKHQRLREDKTASIEDIIKKEAPEIEAARQYLKLVGILRAAFRKKVGESESARGQALEMCKKDPVHFVNYWCYTIDPRMLNLGLIARTPFVLFPKQVEVMKSLHQWYSNRLSGMIDKSREEGVTWTAVAYTAWHFLFSVGFSAILGSEKEEKVDFAGSSDTLFGKLRFLLYDLPTWFRPEEMAKKGNQYDKQRLLINPKTGNEVKGEIGDNIGRSGRSSLLIIDEYQDIAHPEVIRNSVSSTSNCKIYIGTVKGMNHFYLLKNSGEVQNQDIWWFNDPRKNRKWREGSPDMDSPWRKFIEATENPVTIAQEYDGNPNASVEGSVIPAEWVEKAIEWMDPPDNCDNVGGFDIATGRGENESVYIRREGPVASSPYKAPFKTPQECAWGVIHKGIEDEITLLNYDMDGLGESLIGMLQGDTRPIPFRLNGLRGNGRASDELIPGEGRKYSEKFQNQRAERWFALRKRFERTYEHRTGLKKHDLHQLISIPNDRILVTQLSQPKIKEGSRIGVESKKDMKVRGVPSPDRADALVYCFADYNDYDYVAPDFDYSSISDHCKPFTVNHENGVYEQYVSLYQGPDQLASVLICQWWPHACLIEGIRKPLVRIYDEIVEPNADPVDIADKVSCITRNEVYPIKEWVANKEMFGEDWQRSPDRLYARAGVRLKKNYEYDESGALTYLNTMLKNGQIEIHSTACINLIMQLSQWRRKKGRPAEGLNLAKALCNLITRFRETKKIGEKVEPKYYRTESEWQKIKKEATMEYLTGEVR